MNNDTVAEYSFDDVIDNCQVAYHTHGRKPHAIRDCAEFMLSSPRCVTEVVRTLLQNIVNAVNPLIYLNAVVQRRAYLALDGEEFA